VTLQEFLQIPELHNKLVSEAETRGFVTAMAAAPHLINPSEWLPYLWGDNEQNPFEDGAQFEQYAHLIVELWNETRASLLEGHWQWPEGYALDEKDIITDSVRGFAAGMLDGWHLTKDDWETLMPADSEDSALMGGFILSLSMLYDPETSVETLTQEGVEGLDQFEEIYKAVPMMICGLTQRAAMLVEGE
jgi:uncharacterized protein